MGLLHTLFKLYGVTVGGLIREMSTESCLADEWSEIPFQDSFFFKGQVLPSVWGNS